jgi:predicted transcriptional regulator
MIERNSEFESLEELMDYVDKEAESRVKKIMSKYEGLKEQEAYDDVILKLLKDFNQPLSVELISFLTGISKSRCCKILDKLEKKWRIIKKATVSKASYYTLS